MLKYLSLTLMATVSVKSLLERQCCIQCNGLRRALTKGLGPCCPKT